MELLHINEVQLNRENSAKSVKELFGQIKDIESLAEAFVFYTPIVHHLISDAARTAIATDMISHTLALELQEHPLVITDLPRPILKIDPQLIVKPELKSFCRTLYAAPKEVWTKTLERLRMLTVFDRTTHRFCTLVPHVHTIGCPFGEHDDFPLPVQYFNCYGNREILYFRDSELDTEQPPRLCYSPPVMEFIKLADRILHSFGDQGRTPMERAVQEAAEMIDHEENAMQFLAMKQHSDAWKKPIRSEEYFSSQEYIHECHDIIRFYETVFGAS